MAYSCNSTEEKTFFHKNDKAVVTINKAEASKNNLSSFISEIKELCPELESSSIGIDPLMINWDSLVKLSDEKKTSLNFDLTHGNPIKLHSYKIFNDNLFYVITVHEFVDMGRASHVGKLTLIKNNNLIGTIDVASYSNIYSEKMTYSIFETDKRLRTERQIYPEPKEVGELNTTKDSILIITKIIDIETMKILNEAKKWEKI
jgi:hypothetical protein